MNNPQEKFIQIELTAAAGMLFLYALDATGQVWHCTDDLAIWLPVTKKRGEEAPDE